MRNKIKNTLLWSQKYTRTDMSYLVGGSFWLLVGQGVHMGTGFILAFAFANMLSKTDFGTYQFIMSGAAVLGAFTLTGISVAVKKAIANGSEGALRYGFRKQMLWSLIIVLLGCVVATYYFINGNNLLGASFLIVGALVPFLQSFSLYRSYLLGKQLFKETTLMGLWRKPLTLVSVITALFFTSNPAILVFVYLLSSVISLSWIYWLVIKKYNPPIATTEPESDTISYSKHLSFIGIIRMIAKYLDSILIFHFLGAPALAVYVLAKLPVTHLAKVFGTVGNLAFPKFAKNEYVVLKKTLHRKVIIYFITVSVVAIIYIFTAPFIYKLLFPEYMESVLISQILILTLLLKPATLFEKVFESHAIKKIQHVTITSTMVFQILCLLVLLPMYGMWGAVGSVILTHLYWSVMATTLFYTHKHDKK